MHDDEIDDEINDEPMIGLAETLRTLPLFDEPYLQMQAMNLDLIDRFLIDRETDLLHEYIEIERTPFPSELLQTSDPQALNPGDSRRRLHKLFHRSCPDRAKQCHA